MKLSSILGTLALGLGLASATGIEQEAALKSALRGRIEEAFPFFKTEWVHCNDLLEDPRKILSTNCDKFLLPKPRRSWKETLIEYMYNLEELRDELNRERLLKRRRRDVDLCMCKVRKLPEK